MNCAVWIKLILSRSTESNRKPYTIIYLISVSGFVLVGLHDDIVASVFSNKPSSCNKKEEETEKQNHEHLNKHRPEQAQTQRPTWILTVGSHLFCCLCIWVSTRWWTAGMESPRRRAIWVWRRTSPELQEHQLLIRKRDWFHRTSWKYLHHLKCL